MAGDEGQRTAAGHLRRRRHHRHPAGRRRRRHRATARPDRRRRSRSTRAARRCPASHEMADAGGGQVIPADPTALARLRRRGRRPWPTRCWSPRAARTSVVAAGTTEADVSVELTSASDGTTSTAAAFSPLGSRRPRPAPPARRRVRRRLGAPDLGAVRRPACSLGVGLVVAAGVLVPAPAAAAHRRASASTATPAPARSGTQRHPADRARPGAQPGTRRRRRPAGAQQGPRGQDQHAAGGAPAASCAPPSGCSCTPGVFLVAGLLGLLLSGATS